MNLASPFSKEKEALDPELRNLRSRGKPWNSLPTGDAKRKRREGFERWVESVRARRHK